MNTPTLKFYKTGHLFEIYDEGAHITFAFVTKTGEDSYRQLHKQAICKDYATDILFVNKYPDQNDKMFPIHGMRYNVAKNPIDTDALRMSLDGTATQANNWRDNFQALVDLCDACDCSAPTYRNVDEETLILEADKKWQSSFMHIGMFLFFIRNMNKDIKYKGSLDQWFSEIYSSGGDDGKHFKNLYIENNTPLSMYMALDVIIDLAGDNFLVEDHGLPATIFHATGFFYTVSCALKSDEFVYDNTSHFVDAVKKVMCP